MGFDEDEILKMENAELKNDIMKLQNENSNLKSKLAKLECDMTLLKSQCLELKGDMVMKSGNSSNNPDYTLLLKQAINLLQNIAGPKQEEIQQ